MLRIGFRFKKFCNKPISVVKRFRDCCCTTFYTDKIWCAMNYTLTLGSKNGCYITCSSKLHFYFFNQNNQLTSNQQFVVQFSIYSYLTLLVMTSGRGSYQKSQNNIQLHELHSLVIAIKI